MTQDISRRWADEPEAKSIDNYPDPDSVPKSLKDRLATELAVRAVCPDCTAEHYYYSSDTQDCVECRADDCNCDFILP